MPQRPAPLLARLTIALFMGLAVPDAPAADARVGDADSVPDPAKFDDNYPDMKEWAAAGTAGGIPAREAGKVLKTLKPGDDVQAAIDVAGKSGGGGVVLLSAGTYAVARRIDLRNNVILRGASTAGVILENTMRAEKPGEASFTVAFEGTSKAGLEDVTIRHGEVARLGLATYHESKAGPRNDPGGVKDLHVGGVLVSRASDCWIDRCHILHSGSHPLDGQGVRFTLRDTLIDGAFNKGEALAPGGSGNVYFAFKNGLMFNVAVRNVRHCLVMRDTLAGGDCKFNAIVDCNFEGDVNFHGNRRDEGHNLFEGTLVHAPLFHGWPAWSYWKRSDIGEGNLIYKSIGWGGMKGDAFASTDPGKVYGYTGIRDPNRLGEHDKPAPKGGTLFAVTGKRPTMIAAEAWPKSPGEARKVMEGRMPRTANVPAATSGRNP